MMQEIFQKLFKILMISSLSILLAVPIYAQFQVGIKADRDLSNEITIPLSGQIEITARTQVSEQKLTFQWSCNIGSFRGNRTTDPTVYYIPPGRISGRSKEVTVSVTVSNSDNGEEATAGKTFTLRNRTTTTIKRPTTTIKRPATTIKRPATTSPTTTTTIPNIAISIEESPKEKLEKLREELGQIYVGIELEGPKEEHLNKLKSIYKRFQKHISSDELDELEKLKKMIENIEAYIKKVGS